MIFYINENDNEMKRNQKINNNENVNNNIVVMKIMKMKMII